MSVEKYRADFAREVANSRKPKPTSPTPNAAPAGRAIPAKDRKTRTPATKAALAHRSSSPTTAGQRPGTPEVKPIELVAQPTKAKTPRTQPTVRAIAHEVTNTRFGDKRRLAGIRQAGLLALKKPTLMRLLLTVLEDQTESDSIRLAALHAVQTATFQPMEFERHVTDYVSTLHQVAVDRSAAMRVAALEILALRKDARAHELLIAGLQGQIKPLVPPVKALQFIGYDVHSQVYPLLRDLARNPKSSKLVKRTALRLLAADSDSLDIFRTIVADKNSDKASRMTSVVALQSLAPAEFDRLATAIVLDDNDDGDVRASVITAAAQASTRSDGRLAQKVREIDSTPGGTRQLNLASARFTRQQDKNQSARP